LTCQGLFPAISGAWPRVKGRRARLSNLRVVSDPGAA
jgi:hypothetical protein